MVLDREHDLALGDRDAVVGEHEVERADDHDRAVDELGLDREPTALATPWIVSSPTAVTATGVAGGGRRAELDRLVSVNVAVGNSRSRAPAGPCRRAGPRWW